jgi:hypothetical protein
MRSPLRCIGGVLVLLTLNIVGTGAQQEKKPAAPVATSDRIAKAKNVFLKRAGGSEIPYNVISSAFEGWGRYVLVDTSEKADIIVEIAAPSDDSGVRVSSSTKTSPETGKPEQGYSTSKDLSSSPIKMTVYDAKNKIPLWTAEDKPKFAMKQKARENNLVESAERLFSKFHDRVEPPPKQ